MQGLYEKSNLFHSVSFAIYKAEMFSVASQAWNIE